MTDATLGTDQGGRPIQAAALPPTGGTTALSLSTSTASTAALEPGLYRCVSAVACFLAQSGAATVTAAITDAPLAADTVEYFVVLDQHKVAGITASGTGDLSLTKMA